MRAEEGPLPCLIGVTGQVGRRLARAFSARGQGWIGVGRNGAPIRWNMEDDPPDLPDCAGRAVFVLAGVLAQSAQAPGLNTDLALAGIRAARSWGASRCFILSSSSVYGDTGPVAADEGAALRPRNAYAHSKVAMERAAAARDVTILRLANVAGASEPFYMTERPEPRILDRFGDDRGPRRSYIGPETLAQVIRRLSALAEDGVELPPVLNVAEPGEVAMEAILDAAGCPFQWRAAPPEATAHVHMDVGRLSTLMPLEPADAARLLAEAEETGGSA